MLGGLVMARVYRLELTCDEFTWLMNRVREKREFYSTQTGGLKYTEQKATCESVFKKMEHEAFPCFDD